MAQRTRKVIKSYFEAGDIPSEANYGDLIDSFLSLKATGIEIISASVSASSFITHGHITASGNISASGTIYANNFESTGEDVSGITFADDLNITGDITASGYIKGKLVIPNTSGIYVEDAAGNFDDTAVINLTNTAITFGDNDFLNTLYGSTITLDSVGSVKIDSDTGDVQFQDNNTTSITFNTTAGHISSSGNVSASGTGPHYFGGTVSASAFAGDGSSLTGITNTLSNTGTLVLSGSTYSGSQVPANLISLKVTGSIIPEGSGSWDLGSPSHPFRDLFVTTESIKFVNRATGVVMTSLKAQDIADLKEGKSIRDVSDLSAKTYVLDDGREASRQYESRFNRWAPQLLGSEDEIAESDEIPTSYVDFTDQQYSITMQANRSKYVQTYSNITLSSSYASSNTIDIKSPNITFGGGRAGSEATVVVSGSLTVTGSSTFTNWGHFRNRMHNDKHSFQITDNPYVAGGWKYGHTSNHLTGSVPPSHFVVSGSGMAGVGLLNPEHTLHVSSSSPNFNALQVEGDAIVNGFLGANAMGNPTTFSGNTVVPAGYNVVLWTSNNSPSITIPLGANYTVGIGSNIKMVNMDTL
jgi:hypothetical protein